MESILAILPVVAVIAIVLWLFTTKESRVATGRTLGESGRKVLDGVNTGGDLVVLSLIDAKLDAIASVKEKHPDAKDTLAFGNDLLTMARGV